MTKIYCLKYIKQNDDKMTNKSIGKWEDLKGILQEKIVKWKDVQHLVIKEM